MAGILDTLRGWIAGPAPRAATQPLGGGVIINSIDDLEAVIRGVMGVGSGQVVTPDQAMKVPTVYACVRVISGAVATMPLHLKRKKPDGTREDADDLELSKILRRRPNHWQTPSMFRRMMQSHLLLRGNAYALKAVSRGRIQALYPMHPDRVTVDQLPDLSLRYTYSHPNGRRLELEQREVFHLVGLTFDGFRGVTPITYARETLGLALAQDQHGASTFKNGARISHVLSHPSKLGKEGLAFLQESLNNYRAGGESEGKSLILEEGMKIEPLSMTSADAQWIESRKLSRSDIAMFFGVPPHMIGDTEKSTSWGTGIEQQSNGFVAYVLEDHLTMWEEAIARDLITDDAVYARFNRAALVRGDLKARMDSYSIGLQWGIYNPDECRALEDLNPRPDGTGQKFYDPPNTAGGTKKEPVRDPENAA